MRKLIAENQWRCDVCGDLVRADEMRDHLAGHSPAAESAIEDPTEFFSEVPEPGEKTCSLDAAAWTPPERLAHDWKYYRAWRMPRFGRTLRILLIVAGVMLFMTVGLQLFMLYLKLMFQLADTFGW